MPIGRKEDDVRKFGVAAAKRPKILGTLIGPVLTAGVIECLSTVFNIDYRIKKGV
jgi:hypothetical protein